MKVRALILATALLMAVPAAGNTLDDARTLHRAGELDAALLAYDAVAANSDVPLDRATALNNACVILTNRGELETAAERCAQALQLRRDNADAWRVARTLNNVARVQEALGNTDLARANHREALAIYIAANDHESSVISLVNLGVLETNARRHAQALKHYDRAATLLGSVDDAQWTAYQNVLLQLNRGVVLEQIGAYQEALVALDGALDTAPAAAPNLLADLQMNRGVVLRNLGDPVAALAAYREAMSIFDTRGDQAAMANVFLNQALVAWLDQDQVETAMALLERARQIAADTGDATALRETIYFTLRAHLARDRIDAAALVLTADVLNSENWFAFDARARVSFARGNHREALAAAMHALQLIEGQRAALTGQTHRQTMLTDRRSAYALAINILFALFEESADPDFAHRALALSARAKALALLEATGSAAPLSQDNLSSEHETDNTMAMFVGPRHTHVWTTARNTTSWRRHDSQTIERAARRMHGELASGKLPDKTVVDQLMPLLDDLARTSEPLVIAPDGALALVPFEWLMARKSGGETLPGSVRYRAALNSPQVRTQTLGPPQLVALAHGLRSDQTHPALQALPALGHVNAEVRRIARYFDTNATVLMDADASETALQNAPVTAGGVLHIASHAVVDARLDQGAVLILGASEEEDGLLFPREVAALDLPVALTVLSACSAVQSASGVGAPVSNLTGAFLAAGSDAVLTTLWPVDDATSAVVMEQFYAQLTKGLSPAEALRATKTRLMNSSDWNAPWLWSGYVLYGDSQPLVHRPRNTPLNVLAGAALAIIFVLVWIGRRRRG